MLTPPSTCRERRRTGPPNTSHLAILIALFVVTVTSSFTNALSRSAATPVPFGGPAFHRYRYMYFRDHENTNASDEYPDRGGDGASEAQTAPSSVSPQSSGWIPSRYPNPRTDPRRSPTTSPWRKSAVQRAPYHRSCDMAPQRFDCASFNAEARVTATENSIEVGGGLIEKEEQFVEGLLLKACSFTVEMLERNPRDFVDFLDATSRLRSIDLRDLDLSSDAALCLVLNLYHCLLQHSLLLSIEGPPSKKSVGHFKRVSCYEIGNDVFSLAELECCLLRGRMNRPTNPRSPYIEAPKASQTAYRHYALGATDARINFVLHQGDLSCGPTVPIFSPEIMEEQLNAATSAFLSRQVKIFVNRRTIVLPKVCDIYRKDFGSGDPYDCVAFILQYMDEDEQDKIVELFTDETNAPSIKYQPGQQTFLTNLTLML